VDGKFQLDVENTKAFERVGLVAGAVFSDLNNDGAPDLVLACEWGPVRVFRNSNSRLVEITKEAGLDSFAGWWNGVTTGDFNRDGTVQTLEAFLHPASRKWVPWRRLDAVSKAMPFVSATFATFEQFAQADVPAILGERLALARFCEATCLESTVFLNRGEDFLPVPLPLAAQLAPAFALGVADLDGNGTEDLFLSQNFFAVPPEVSRYDAGRSLWLRGNGRGQFEAVSGSQSGLLVYGEQRAAALSDYDADGRVDIVVTQNGAPTRLFQNQAARQGLRVRLRGPENNPDAIGAILRLTDLNGPGPARELHAGAGYWSQDSAVQVLAPPRGPAELEVRWPGGATSRAKVPEGAREIEMDLHGSLRQLR
jgi:hypothetical protein